MTARRAPRRRSRGDPPCPRRGGLVAAAFTTAAAAAAASASASSGALRGGGCPPHGGRCLAPAPAWFLRAGRLPGRRQEASFSDYRVLIDAPLPDDVDLQAVEKELAAEQWTDDTLLIKALVQEGAHNVDVFPWAGRSRDMTFQLRLGIPWDRVKAYLRIRGREDVDADTHAAATAAAVAVPARSGGATDVAARHNVYIRPRELVLVESSYAVATPALRLRMIFALKEGKYVFGSAIEFDPKGRASSLTEYRVVRRFMEMGFMEAAKKYGRTLLMELRKKRGRHEPHHGSVVAAEEAAATAAAAVAPLHHSGHEGGGHSGRSVLGKVAAAIEAAMR